MQSVNVNLSLLKQLKEVFPQHSDITIATILYECDNEANASITRLLAMPENDEPPTSNSVESLKLRQQSIPDEDQSCVPHFQYIADDTQKYSIGFEYSIIFNRTDEQGLDINVKAIGQRILVNELYINKITGLPGLSAQAGVLPGDVFVGINDEYFNVGCALPDVTRITRAAGNVITLQFFRFYDNSFLLDALAAARQGQSIADINSEHESHRIAASLSLSDSNQEMLYHQYNCQMNNYRDLYTYRQRLLIGDDTKKIHHCAFLLREQDLLKEDDIEIFSETVGRLLARCLLWDSGNISERTRVADILLTMLSTGPLNTTTVHSYDGNYGTGFTLNSLHFLPPQPNIPWLQTQLPVQFNVSPTAIMRTPSHSRTPLRQEDRRSSMGNTSRRNSVGAVPLRRSVSQQCVDIDAMDTPINASIRLLWKKAVNLNTKQLRPALAIRIISINVVDKSHFEYKIWVNDIDSGLEWYVHRRFSEFYNFRETVVAIWPIFARIHFPSRRISMSASTRTANERLPVLEQFLRAVYAVIAVQPLTHTSTRAIYAALQEMLDVTFRKDGIEATIQNNRELFLNSQKVTAHRVAEEEEALISSRAMSTESQTSTRNSTKDGDKDRDGGSQTRGSDTPCSNAIEEKDGGTGVDNTSVPTSNILQKNSTDSICNTSSPRVTWRRQGKVIKTVSSAPSTPTCTKDLNNNNTAKKEEGGADVISDERAAEVMRREGSLHRLGMLMADMTTSPSDRPRRHSLFDEDDLEGGSEREEDFLPAPPQLSKCNGAHTAELGVGIGHVASSSPTVDVEVEHELVSLRSPSGGSSPEIVRKRLHSGTLRTHLPNFDSAVSESEGHDEEVAERGDNGQEEVKLNLIRSSSGDEGRDRERSTSHSRVSNENNTPTHPSSYSRLLANRLEVFIHWVLQVPTFRHIIDPFVKNFRKKILEWELDRSFVFTEELVYERLKYIGEFIDNLQELLLEGLSADMDSLCIYVLSKHCDEAATSTTHQPLFSSADPSSSHIDIDYKEHEHLSKSFRCKTTSLSSSRLFNVRTNDEHTIDRSTNRGRSFSVNDGHMSNVSIPGVDLESIYRKVIRRQIELEVYYPSRDAVQTMMSQQFGTFDFELERKCNILKHKPQTFFGISFDNMSPSSWEAAISAFSRVATVYSIPVDKLDALVVAAKLIPELFDKEHDVFSSAVSGSGNGGGGSGDDDTTDKRHVAQPKVRSLGADDMLPIFIYCIVMSDIPYARMQSLVHELDYICDPQSRYSEVGYFVTTFQASIQHILQMDEEQGESIGSSL